MKTNIYFVRHAQSDFSIRDEINRPLTEKGLADTKKVTKALMDKDISAIYSSPYKRTIDTILDFAETNGYEIITDHGFSERNVGIWVEDFKAYSQKQWEDFDFKLINGESLREVQNRNIASLFNVLKSNLGKNIVIGTHGTALSTMINYFNLNYGYDDFWGLVDKMPYILCFTFDQLNLENMKEIEMNE